MGSKENVEEYDLIFGDGSTVELVDDYDRPYCDDPTYEEIYDEDGDIAIVKCNRCAGGYVYWKDGKYVCYGCGEEMTREEFFNAIGAEPPGPECLVCDSLYPGCLSCRYGYVEEEEF